MEQIKKIESNIELFKKALGKYDQLRYLINMSEILEEMINEIERNIELDAEARKEVNAEFRDMR